MIYTVKRGDTLSKIAHTWGTFVRDIMRINPEIKNKNIIHVGQKIRISTFSASRRPTTSGGMRPTINRSSPQVTGLMCEFPESFHSTYTELYIDKPNSCELSDEQFQLANQAATREQINTSLKISPKDTWGIINTDYSKLEKDWDYTTIAIHHSGNSGSNDPLEIEKKHMLSRGWNNVGYHYLVKRDGTIYEGTELGYKGSHVGGANTGKIGILVMGDYHHQFWDFDDDLSKVQINSTVALINKLKEYFSITILGGHRDFKTGTDCPGDVLYNKLDDIRSKSSLNKP